MYDSITQHDFDRVSGAVDKDTNQVSTNNIKPTYNDTNTDSAKDDQNIMTKDKDIETQDNIQDIRHDHTDSYARWSTDANQIDNQYLRDYYNMCRQIEDA